MLAASLRLVLRARQARLVVAVVVAGDAPEAPGAATRAATTPAWISMTMRQWQPGSGVVPVRPTVEGSLL